MGVKKLQLVIVCLAISSFILASSAAKTKSLTWDEATFFVSGYSYLDNKEFILNPETPPFLQALVAFPLKFLNLKSPDYSHFSYNAHDQVYFANLFLEINRDKLGEISFWARLPIWLLLALLVIVVGLFVNTIAGPTPAIIASTLVAFSPNLIAHGQLATTDLGCTVFMFISVYTFYLAIRSENYKPWVICGIFTGVALLTKFTALLLAPIFFIFILYEIIFNGRCNVTLFRGLVLLVFFILLVLCIGYGFRPWLYIYGMSQIYVRKVEYQYYLFGKVLFDSVWYYYFAALLVKTPVSTLLLLVISAYVTIRYHPERDAVVYLLVPAGLIMFVCCFDVTNLGLRRILPLYPFLLSFVSYAVFYPNPDKVKIFIFNTLVACSVVSAMVTYPHYISYFNTLAGGARNGPNLLDDSNLDWGQDLIALVEWQKNNHPGEPINLKYFGSMNPDLYGLLFRRISDNELINPRNGIYAISTHFLIYTRKLADRTNVNIDWLELYKPIGYAGNSIYIYQFSDKSNE